MGLFTALAGDRAVAWSAGSMPGRVVDSEAVTAMAAHDIDISGEYPKPWTEEIIRAADVVVTMGCGDACPVLPGPRYQNWKIDGPPVVPQAGSTASSTTSTTGSEIC